MKTIKEGFQIAFRYILAIAIVYGFFYILGNMTTMEIPDKNKELVYMVVGVIIGKFGTIVDFEWGTSRSSKDKDEIIAKQSDKLTDTPPAPPVV